MAAAVIWRHDLMRMFNDIKSPFSSFVLNIPLLMLLRGPAAAHDLLSNLKVH